MIDYIIQLDLFDYTQQPKKIGRPPKIDKEIVFAVKDDLNKGLNNKSIIKKYDINLKQRFFILN